MRVLSLQGTHVDCGVVVDTEELMTENCQVELIVK